MIDNRLLAGISKETICILSRVIPEKSLPRALVVDFGRSVVAEEQESEERVLEGVFGGGCVGFWGAGDF